jgi:phage FluMu gp28-like protein
LIRTPRRNAFPPILPLLPYQQAWMDDPSPYKIICKSRQIGFTWIETLAIVFACVEERRKWYYLSLNEQRAAEAIAYVQQHCQALELLTELDDRMRDFDGASYRQLGVTFPNGSQIIGLPSNPRTARGASGDVTLDEFGHQPWDKQIWMALSPLMMWNRSLHVISTPNGKQGEYHGIWTGNLAVDVDAVEALCRRGEQHTIGDEWSRHWIDVYTAKEQGHPVDIDKAKRLARSEDVWLQEYCCKFLDEAYAWLPWALIERACRAGETFGASHQLTDAPVGTLVGGYDVGRERHPAVLWINEHRGERIITRHVQALHKAGFDEQEAVISKWMPQLSKFSIDATGIGAGLSERLEKRYRSRVNQVKFTGDMPVKLATELRRLFELNRIALADSSEIRLELHSVRRTFTKLGNVQFSAPDTIDGHADRFWALALAIHAADAGLPLLSGNVELEPRKVIDLSDRGGDYV